MAVFGQLLAPTSLKRGSSWRYPQNSGLGGPQQICYECFWKREKCFSFAGGRTLNRRANILLSTDNAQFVKNASAFYKIQKLTLLFTTVIQSDLPCSSRAYFASLRSAFLTYSIAGIAT